MIVKPLNEYHLTCLSLKGGCRGSSESTLVKMSNCWKSHAAAQIILLQTTKQMMKSIMSVLVVWMSQTLMRMRIIYLKHLGVSQEGDHHHNLHRAHPRLGQVLCQALGLSLPFSRDISQGLLLKHNTHKLW